MHKVGIQKIVKYLKDEKYRWSVNEDLGVLRFLPDQYFLKRKFFYSLGYELNLDNPQTFNEKLQWLKLNNRQPKYVNMVDKSAVKEYVGMIIGEQYLVRTLGVWERFDDINFDSLPNSFVLKCTHDSGGVIVVKNKSEFDKKKARASLTKALGRNFYYFGREWPYKKVHPQIIAEELLVDRNQEELKDFKLMCFNGEVKCSFVCSQRYSDDGLRVTFFDREWNVMPFERHYRKSDIKIPKPQKYEKMIELA